jgi:uracil-DNA glycosylase
MTLYLEDFLDSPALSDVFPTTSVTTLDFLKTESKKAYFKKLNDKVVYAYFSIKCKNIECYPQFNQIFRALEETPLERVKVVIIGQDSYHGPNQANGLCFSVNSGITAPPSLKNIFKELYSDLGVMRTDTDLSDWARQGVLLINATLTVEKGKPNSHVSFGWKGFTNAVVKYISDNNENVVWLLWGAFAQEKCASIDSKKHLVLKAAHPSPFSVTGFYGCKHFSKTNEFLKKHKIKEIIW